MADVGETSLAPFKSTNQKPIVVRVKRKAFQSRIEAFWLEINERPSKRAFSEFEKLSISDSSGTGVEINERPPKWPHLDIEKLSISGASGKENLKTNKVLVRHLKTVRRSEATADILQSFGPNSENASKRKPKGEERRHALKKESQKHDELLVRARQEQEALAKSARFEQIWKSRKENEDCRLYDVVRVDTEEKSTDVKSQDDTSLEDHMVMRNYLPLLREFIPGAAEEIESDIYAHLSGIESKEEYVYDLYIVKDDMDTTEEDASHPFPLVQVDDDDEFYAGPAESEYGSDDSNAEDNPGNDYPDEDEMSDEEEENESEASDDEFEESESEKSSDKSPKFKVLDGSSDNGDVLFEEECYIDEDGNYVPDDDEEEGWR